MRLAVQQHLRALERPDARVVYHNARERIPRWLQRVEFDGIVLHTTFLCTRWYPNFDDYERRFRWLAERDGPKVALPQDEYDHSGVLDEWLAGLGATHVFSNFGENERAALYPTLATRAEFSRVLTGYIEESTADRLANRVVPHNQRAHDLVYRAARLPYWFGSHGQLKHRIGDAARRSTRALGLDSDVSTDSRDTIFGDRWLEFVMSGRAIVGAESGSSVLDPRGLVRRRIERLLAVRPELTFEEVSEQMPEGWDSYEFFALSPRHLEAVITKTAQVLVEGSYSGVLEAGRHYLPVRSDLSDLDDALEQLQDPSVGARITEQAYEDIYRSKRYTYSVFADEVWHALGEGVSRRRLPDTIAGIAFGARALRQAASERAGVLAWQAAADADSALGRALGRALSAYRVSREPANEVTLRTIIRRSAARGLRALRAR